MTRPPRDPPSATAAPGAPDDPLDDGGGDFEETPSAELAHQRIIATLGELHAEARPRDDWQRRVLTSIREPTSPVIAAASAASVAAAATVAAAAPSSSSEAPSLPAAGGAQGALAPVIPLFRRRSFQVGAGGALAAAAALVLWVKSPGTGPSPQLLVEISDSGRRPERGPSRQGETRGAVGSTLRISAQSKAPHRALWIYRGDKHLVLACPGPGCAASDDELTAELVVPLAGEYQVVALWSQHPIPAPAGQRDEDLAAAERAGATKRAHSFSTW